MYTFAVKISFIHLPRLTVPQVLVLAHSQTLIACELDCGDDWLQTRGDYSPSLACRAQTLSLRRERIQTLNHNVVWIKPSAVQVVFPELACGNEEEGEDGEEKETKETIPGRPQC